MIGKGDWVYCFHCEGGLSDWEPDDDPWEEHAKKYPNCGYLNMKKSPDYVRKIQEKLRNSSVGK